MADEPDIDEFLKPDEVQELRRSLSRAQFALQRSKAKTADLIDAVYQAARDAALIQGNPPSVPKPSADRRKKKPEVALLLLSDWHFGKETISFNSAVAAERIRLLARKTVKITEVERADHPVREAHVMLGGDMIENLSIFPGQAFEVDSTAFQQLFAVVSSVAEMLRSLLATFPTVHVWEQFGNHGRIGRKGDHPRSDNIDVLVYRIAEMMLADEKSRLTWHYATSWHTIVEVGHYKALLIHGDQIKSFGGNTPSYGIARKTNAWASGVVGDFIDVYMGHFHQPITLPLANGKGRVFVNPSIESDSEYAREFVAATGTPGQRLFFIDPDKGRITSERVLWLD